MKFEFYREADTIQLKSDPLLLVPIKTNGGFRWRLRAKNGRIIANGGEGYQRIGDMLKILEKIFGGDVERRVQLELAWKEFQITAEGPLQTFSFTRDN